MIWFGRLFFKMEARQIIPQIVSAKQALAKGTNVQDERSLDAGILLMQKGEMITPTFRSVTT